MAWKVTVMVLPLTVVEATVDPAPTGVALTWPAPAAVVGAVQPEGTWKVAYELPLKLFCPERKWKVKLFVLPGNTLPGSIATVPSPLLSVKVHDAVS